MKEYNKPIIEDEDIEIEDICSTSGGETEEGVEQDFPWN